MAKSRDVQRNLLRKKRTPLLAALDVEYQRADEAGDLEAKKAVSAKKQELRDATKYASIDSAKTINELKEAIPPCLIVAVS